MCIRDRDDLALLGTLRADARLPNRAKRILARTNRLRTLVACQAPPLGQSDLALEIVTVGAGGVTACWFAITARKLPSVV